MVALGRPGLLAGLVGGLIGHDFRFVAPLLTCGGGAPAYFTPGFAPLSLAWGWLLVGLLLGALTSKVIEQVATRAWPSPAPCSNGAGGRCSVLAQGRRKRAGYGSGGGGAAAGRVAGNIARGPIAGSAKRRGANPSADQCESLGPPPPAPLARPRQRRPSVIDMSFCRVLHRGLH